MRRLFFDFETFSSADIGICGAYKYTQSPDFEVLLLAYAFDDGPVTVVDFMAGEAWPPEFIAALSDPSVEKWSHNASFERDVLRAVGISLDPRQQRCSLAKAAYSSLPLSLGELSQVLGLQELGKKATGRALIAYFCKPCKPTKANGMRSRNMPQNDLARWEEFKTYCKYDVLSEREAVRRLDPISMPEMEQKIWETDQRTNDYGVRTDPALAENALRFERLASEGLEQDMKAWTGLPNPNSVVQLKHWLRHEGVDMPELGRQQIQDYLKRGDVAQPVRRVLEGRLALAKTSVRKYAAVLNCTADDSRVHGLFQYYGANRTGRWVSRLVQLQNLPQNHLPSLEHARQLVKDGSWEEFELNYAGMEQDVLSQLIRTAFVAPEGKMLAVMDFSAIEARVLAWLAQEGWRLDVFNTHGKIYEASASLMFHVPIESVTKGSDLRQRGKTAELALGYEGGVGAMQNMDKEKKLSRTEMESIVRLWRKTSPMVVKLWKDLNEAAMYVVRTHQTKDVSCLHLYHDGLSLGIRLPSGRSLFYRNPRIRPNRFGKDALAFDGMAQDAGWSRLETYGGKLTENVVQAVARDLLAEAMVRVDAAGYPVVMHVHDECVAEVPKDNAPEHLARLVHIMEDGAEWTRCMPKNVEFKAAGFLTEHYMKD